MNSVNLSQSNPQSRQDLLTFKISALGCGTLILLGWLTFTISGLQAIAKANPEDDIKAGDGRRDLIERTRPKDEPIIISKSSQKPVIVEEGSEAYYCLKDNGGSSCLNRSRKVEDYRVEPTKTYEDYLVQYGVREINCGQYFNGRPNC